MKKYIMIDRQSESSPSQGQLQHLNSILQALHNINQLVVHEKDMRPLIQKTCDILVKKQGYHSVWIALNSANGPPGQIVQNGFKRHFQTFAKSLKQGVTVHCMQRALDENKVIAIHQTLKECGNCPLKGEYGKNGSLSVILQHEGKHYGWFTAAVDRAFVDSKDEHMLLDEIAGALAFAFFSFENEQKRKNSLQTLKKEYQLLSALIDAPEDIIIFSLDRDYRYTAFNANHEKEMRAVYGVDIKIGMNMLDLISAPEVRQKAKKSFDRALSGERFCETEKLPETGVYYELRWAPVKSYAGKTVGLTAFIRNITENKLAEEENRKFRKIIETTSQATVIATAEGQIAYVNDGFLAMLGYKKKDEILGKSIFDFTDEKGVRKLKEEIITALMDSGHWRGVINNKRKDGSLFPADETCSVIKNEQGQPEFFVAVFVDITERKQTEARLRESEANLRSLINARHESIWSIDKNYCFLIFNEKFAADYKHAYGITIKKGMSATDILSAKLLKFWQPKYEQALAGERLTFEFSESLPDGVHYYEVALNPIKAGKEILGVSAISLDTTERKKIESALHETEERFRLAFLTSPDSININRLEDGLYVDINQGFTEITGYTREDVIGKTSLEIDIWANPADRQRLAEGLKKEGRVNNLEAQFRMKDGTIITGLMSASVIMLQDGPHILSITRSIEELKELERERERFLTETEAARKLLSDVLSRINDGVVALDKYWRYTYLNDQAAKMLNREKPDDLLGKHIWTEYPESVDQPFYKAYYKAMETQQVIYLQEYYTPWDRWFENRIYPSPDGLTIYLTEITERKQAEQALSESEERYRYLFENSPVALWEEDLTEMITYLNKLLKTQLKKQNFRTFLDTHPQEVQNLIRRIHILDVNQATLTLHQAQDKQQLIDNLESLFTEDSYEIFKEELLSIAQGGVAFSAEERVKTIYGEIKDIILRFSLKRPISPSEGRYIGLIATIDITPLKQARRELEKSLDELQQIYELSLRISNSREVKQVAKEVLRAIREAVNPDMAVFYLLEKDKLKLLAQYTNETKTAVSGAQRHQLCEYLCGLAARSGQPVFSQDILKDRRYALDKYKKAGIRSFVSLPLLVGDRVLGAVGLGSLTKRDFSTQKSFMETLSNEIAISLQNINLNEQIQRRFKELKSIHNASLQLHSLRPPEVLAEDIIRILETNLEYDYGAVLLIDESTNKLIPFAISDQGMGKDFIPKDMEYIKSHDINVGKGITGWVAKHGQTVRINDVHKDPRYFGIRPEIKSEMCLPLKLNDKIIGVINFETSKPNAYSESDQRIIETLAIQIALAIQQTNLHDQIKHHSEQLELRVHERTAELERANKELESFSYSVSHDLRAPLRAIDGFSRILAEDYMNNLDDEAKRLIGVVRDNTQRMGQLIDDLLNFSRISRQSVTPSRVDLANLADSIFYELTDDAQRKKIRFRVQKLPPALADASLMRQVFYNLIANALKFSSGRKVPEIEIGFTIEDRQTVYYIKDNGVGFDMQYAGKLFQIFQRLHTTDEFPGTGIGLSIVQRIITRHGGRIWAEAQEGKGATFYFTLKEGIIN